LQERGFDVASSERTEKETEEGFTSDEVASVLGKIEEPYRSAVIMRYIDDLSPKQIAQSLGESVNVVSVRINRGMKKLKSLLPVT
jgi:RNA polymerase sigma factor (sigma-70 family)